MAYWYTSHLGIILAMKNNYDNSQKIYEKDKFVILKVHSNKKVGYIVYNTQKEWKDGHTHLDSFNMAKTIISNVLNHKKPKTSNMYLLKSHIRLSDDESYIKFIEELMTVKKSKQKQEYRNRTY